MSSISLSSGLANLDPASLAGSLSQSAAQITALLPSTATSLFNSNSSIYDVVGSQALGELGGSPGWQAYVLAQSKLSAPSSTGTSAPASGSTDSSTGAATGTDSTTGTNTTTAQTGSVTDQLLKEAGWQAPDPNPYAVTRDFFAYQSQVDAQDPYPMISGTGTGGSVNTLA